MFSLRVVVSPPPPPPQGETEARERLRKPVTNRVPCHLIIFYCEVRDKQQDCSEFILIFSNKFAIQRPIENIYFALRI